VYTYGRFIKCPGLHRAGALVIELHPFRFDARLKPAGIYATVSIRIIRAYNKYTLVASYSARPGPTDTFPEKRTRLIVTPIRVISPSRKHVELPKRLIGRNRIRLIRFVGAFRTFGLPFLQLLRTRDALNISRMYIYILCAEMGRFVCYYCAAPPIPFRPPTILARPRRI